MRATEVADRLTCADTALWTSWLRSLQERTTNPYGIMIQDFDGAIALHCHAIPSTHFNRIMNVGPENCYRLGDIVGFFSERFTPVRVDLSPFGADQRILSSLSSSGLKPVELQSNLYLELSPRSGVNKSDIRVREVEEAEVSGFAAMYEKAYNYARGTPPGIVSFRTASILARWGRPDWRFYVAEVDGAAVAGAVLHLDGEVATLAGGATLPVHRGRGCQRALLIHRIAVARRIGAEIVASRCAVGSTSQRNMEAVGLTTAFTKLIWAQSPAEPVRPQDHGSTRLLRAV